VAERAGHASPGRLQHLLPRAKWDTDGVAVDLRSYVVKHLGDADAVLIIDETGDLKKGTAKVGVQRQYTGTAGRIENAQVAVYLAYAASAGHTLIDRRLYLPKAWCDDRERRGAAGVPMTLNSPPNRTELDPVCWTRLIPGLPWGKRDDPTRWQDGIIPMSSSVTRSRCTGTPRARRSR
jgi:SRSO17 transposase